MISDIFDSHKPGGEGGGLRERRLKTIIYLVTQSCINNNTSASNISLVTSGSLTCICLALNTHQLHPVH